MQQSFGKFLQQHAQQSREQRLDGNHHHGQDSAFPLIGTCFDNSYVLYHRLVNAGLSPVMVEGTTNRVADELIQAGEDVSQYSSTEQLAGLVHYWIEVEDQEADTWTVDIASDTHEHLGEVIVKPRRPDGYVTLPDSVKQGQLTLDNVRERGTRCSVCGGHKYRHGGCAECEGIISADLE